MAYFSASCEGDEPGDFSGFIGPGHVDQTVRQAIQMCWMMLPKERRTVDEVDRQMRRLLERALKDLREDQQAFPGIEFDSSE